LGKIGGKKPSMPQRKDPRIPDAVLDQLLAGAAQWIMPPREWSMAKSQFAVVFGERFTMAMA
jgi:hypothetical protein